MLAPGQAKRELIDYLESNRKKGMEAYEKWVSDVQYTTGGETKIYKNGRIDDLVPYTWGTPTPPSWDICPNMK